jgi:hypothetical protein
MPFKFIQVMTGATVTLHSSWFINFQDTGCQQCQPLNQNTITNRAILHQSSTMSPAHRDSSRSGCRPAGRLASILLGTQNSFRSSSIFNLLITPGCQCQQCRPNLIRQSCRHDLTSSALSPATAPVQSVVPRFGWWTAGRATQPDGLGLDARSLPQCPQTRMPVRCSQVLPDTRKVWSAGVAAPVPTNTHGC